MGEPLGWSNLKGCWAGRLTCGCPGPLAFTWQSVMALAIAHQPSSAFLDCHGISGKVGWFPNPWTHSGE